MVFVAVAPPVKVRSSMKTGAAALESVLPVVPTRATQNAVGSLGPPVEDDELLLLLLLLDDEPPLDDELLVLPLLDDEELLDLPLDELLAMPDVPDEELELLSALPASASPMALLPSSAQATKAAAALASKTRATMRRFCWVRTGNSLAKVRALAR